MWDENVLKEQTERGYVCPNASCCKCDGGGGPFKKESPPPEVRGKDDPLESLPEGLWPGLTTVVIQRC